MSSEFLSDASRVGSSERYGSSKLTELDSGLGRLGRVSVDREGLRLFDSGETGACVDVGGAEADMEGGLCGGASWAGGGLWSGGLGAKVGRAEDCPAEVGRCGDFGADSTLAGFAVATGNGGGLLWWPAERVK